MLLLQSWSTCVIIKGSLILNRWEPQFFVLRAMTVAVEGLMGWTEAKIVNIMWKRSLSFRVIGFQRGFRFGVIV